MASISHRLQTSTLLKIYNEMKRHPKRTYIRKDFKSCIGSKRCEIYLSLLVRLKIVEMVPVIVDYGRYYAIKQGVNGYRLIQERKLPVKYVKAGEAYVKAGEACKKDIEKLHKKECPNCPWNGRSIFR